MRNRAIVFTAVGRAEVEEFDLDDSLEPDEVLVRTAFNGICQGEVYTFRGQRGANTLPRVMGHEPVGTVVKVGKACRDLQPGDKVTALAGQSYAQYFKVRQGRGAKIPAEVEDLRHWLGEPVACVVNCLRLIQVQPAQEVTLVGCGFMGSLILQGLLHTLAGRITVLDENPHRTEFATGLGAVAEERPEQDIVIEASGSAEGLARAERLVRRGGTLCIFAHHLPNRSVDTDRWHVWGLRVLNTSPGASSDMVVDLRAGVKLIERGVFDLSPLMTHTFPFQRAQEAMEMVASRRPTDYVKGVFSFE